MKVPSHRQWSLNARAGEIGGVVIGENRRQGPMSASKIIDFAHLWVTAAREYTR
jgi:hypothetical protein